MDQKQEIRFEIKMALVTLRKWKNGKDVRRAEAAKRILEDRELFISYVECRLERKRKAERKEKFLTGWKKLVKMFQPWVWKRA